MNRIDFLSDRYREALPEALARADAGRRPVQDADSLWAEVVGLDPSRHKRYLGWICSQTAGGRLKSEDFYKVPLALAELERARPMMRRAGVSCDIGQYASLAALNAALMPFEQQSTPAELEAAERAAIDDETVVHVRNEHLLVVEPKTERASCFWGRGTKWCTAATEAENRFSYYAENGQRLLIFILSDGTKYQGCTDGDFADAADFTESVPPADLAAAIRDEGSAAALMLVKSMWLNRLPISLQTERVRAIAVAQDGHALQFIPADQQSERVREIAVARRGLALQFVPVDQQSDRVRKIAVKKNGVALKFIPPEDQTELLRDIAVAKTGLALQFIPADQQTERLREIAVAQDGRALEFIPVDQQTERLREIAVARRGLALQFVPIDQQTERLREIAVAQDGRVLRFIPADQQTERVREIAVAQNGWALEFIPADQQSERIREIAAAQDGWALRYIPADRQTERVREIALAQDLRALRLIADDQRTERIKAIARREIAVAMPNYVIPTPGVFDAAAAPLEPAA